jgi:hypothetical protein
MDPMNVVVDAPPSAAPPSLRATAGVVDLWRADLSAPVDGGGADEHMELLCEQERARAARIVSERKRVLWACSRGVLRALLGRYLDADPRELRFTLGPYGKPALREPDGRGSGLRFNLSHSGELMLVAVTAGREVGVDVELVRDRHPAEFLHEWTMREAKVKCLGTGLAAAPVADDGSTDGLWATAVDVGPRAIAAVAVHGEEACELRCRAPTGETQAWYSNGSSPASSLRRGAAESRSETISSDTGSGHSIAMSGSSQAMPRSIAGS